MILPGAALPAVQEAAPPSATALLRRAQESVLLVRSPLGGIQAHQGSGVVIAPGLVATNAHVAEGGHGLVVYRGSEAWRVTRVRMDRARDLCLLTVPGLTAPAVTLAPAPAEVGQAVVAMGYPGGQDLVVSRGRLRGIWHYEEGRLLQSDAVALPGNSGGGLFDAEGRLLGLTSFTFAASPRLSFAVPVDWIRELVARPDLTDAGRPEASRPGAGPGVQDADLLGALAADPRNWPAWETAARQWVHDLPMDPNAWLALGLALDRSARASAEAGEGVPPAVLQESAGAYRRSLELQQKPRAWNNLGATLDQLNRFDEAERAFLEALALEPGYALAWMNLGCARINARRFAAGAEAFRKGLALRPDDAEAWMRLAHCQQMLGQREAAVGTLEIALRYRPLAAELWLDLGLLLVDLGRREEALAVQARLADLDPQGAARLQGALKRVRSTRSPAGAATGMRGR
ncbi:hypothetical protein GETHOR_03250 [Geothrix oryzae]|uniref:Serine protease n=1 Tax=Geothrix oryzae TaxID=2927975 RepID=A0ABM8DMT7_9BACT|nr:tetratricopeptide repeat-containing serine protease family protein [Geothrix oryzae]BDU68224.1 hypothetical protein GETHOR_03250 [Geothrix oryzae]